MEATEQPVPLDSLTDEELVSALTMAQARKDATKRVFHEAQERVYKAQAEANEAFERFNVARVP